MSQPSGNLNGATVSFSTPLSGAVVVSNGILNYTGSGSPGSLGSGSNLQNIELNCPSGQSLNLNNQGNITINQCTLNCGIAGNGMGDNVTITKNIIQKFGFTGIFFDPPGNNFVITDNKIICDGLVAIEPIHFVNGTQSGMVISYNECVGAGRIGIEIQCENQSPVCQGNYIHGFTKNLNGHPAGTPVSELGDNGDDHMGISWACGPNSTNTSFSTNALIDSNVILMDGACAQPLNCGYSQNAAIEFMGNNGMVSNNYAWNCGYNAYTFTNGFTSKNNKWIGFEIGQVNPWAGEPGGGPGGQPTIQGDQVLPFVPFNQLTIPTAGPRVTPGYNVNPPTGVTITATNNGNGSATFVAASDPSNGTVIPSLILTPTGDTSLTVTFPLTLGQLSVTVNNVPANWVVVGQFEWGTTSSQQSASVQVLGGPTATSNAWSPTVSTPTPPPPPVTPVAVTATNNGNGQATFVAASDPSQGSVAPTFTLTPTGDASIAKIFTLTAGQTTVQISNIPANWVVTGQFAWGTTSSLVSPTVQVLGGPASPTPDSNWAPTDVTTPPPPPPPATKTITKVVITYSDGTTTTLT